MMFRKVLFATVVFAAMGAFAGEADVQVRSMLHYQRGSSAGWAVVPDWTADNRKVLFVGGLLWKHVDKGAGTVRWTEIMTGGFMDETRFEPVLNVRAFRSGPSGDAYAEVLQNLRLQRTVVVANVLVPLASHLKGGSEAEIVRQDGKKLVALLGVRANVPFSCAGKKCVLGSTYFANVMGGDDVLRVYALVNF